MGVRGLAQAKSAVLLGDLDAEGAEVAETLDHLGRDLSLAVDPVAVHLLGEEALQRRRVGVEAVAEDVDVLAVLDGGDLDAGHEAHGGRARRRFGAVEAGDRVVIGDRERCHAGGTGTTYQLLGGATSVRGCSVSVEVDQRAARAPRGARLAGRRAS